jgi:UDP-3-O-[3-hydroxymyristoyl] glucosamine N-acyltransferase
MDKGTQTWTLGELASLLGGDLHGPADMAISGPVTPEANDPTGIAFCESAEYLAQAVNVGALLLPRELSTDKPHISVDHPRHAFLKLLALADKPLPIAVGIHPQAVVDPSATIHETASIGPFVVIGGNVTVGAGTKIYPFCYVGERCHIGENSILHAHAVMYKDITLGDRSIIHSGSVLGADGFGFLWDGKRRIKVPQAGKLRLGDDVEIGANTTVDRATIGDTIIGNGSKLDNLVQVGHNCTIGENTVIAGLTGISGSSHIGSRCIFGGQSALSDHTRIGDDITFAGRTATSKDITTPGVYFGSPALPIGDAMRVYTLATRVPELFKRVKELEKALERLEKKD